MDIKTNIAAGRKAVDDYRTAHAALYTAGSHRKSIPEEHTPLLNVMMDGLKKQGFNSLDEFFTGNNQLNLEETGLAGKANLTIADRETLNRMWC